MSTKLLAFLFLLALLVFVIELVRREKLTFKYAAGWVLVSLAGIILVIFDNLVRILAEFFGFLIPSNFIFFCCVSAGIFVCLFLTIFLCQQNSRNDRIVQKIGLLEQEVAELRKKVAK